MRCQELGARSQKPGARNQHGGVRSKDQKSETRSQEPGGDRSWKVQQGASSKEVLAARIAVISLLDLQEVLFPDG